MCPRWLFSPHGSFRFFRDADSDRPRTRRVLHDPHLLQRDETFADHLVEDGKKSLHVFLRIHDLDHDRKVLGQRQEVRRMKDATRAEPPDSLEDRRAGEPPRCERARRSPSRRS